MFRTPFLRHFSTRNSFPGGRTAPSPQPYDFATRDKSPLRVDSLIDRHNIVSAPVRHGGQDRRRPRGGTSAAFFFISNPTPHLQTPQFCPPSHPPSPIPQPPPSSFSSLTPPPSASNPPSGTPSARSSTRKPSGSASTPRRSSSAP